MSHCNEIQQKIAELEFNQTLQNQIDLDHLEKCQSCQDYLLACNEMNLAIQEMSEFDADDALVESTLTSITSLQQETKRPTRLLNIQWASGLAASFMLISLIALFPYNSISNFGLFSENDVSSNQLESLSEQERQRIDLRKEAKSKNKDNSSEFEFVEVELEQKMYDKSRSMPMKAPPPSSRMSLDQVDSPKMNVSSFGLDQATPVENTDSDESLKSVSEEIQEEIERDLNENTEEHIKFGSKGTLKEMVSFVKKDVVKSEEKRKSSKPKRQIVGQALIDYDSDINNEPAEDLVEKKNNVNLGDNLELAELEKVVVTGARMARKVTNQPLEQDTNDDGKFRARQDSELASIKAIQKREEKRNNTEDNFNDGLITSEIEDQSDFRTQSAKQFLQGLNSLENLSFQIATGYWANTYLPGDSTMRMIEGRLENNKSLNLSNGISQNIQPFDYPTNSALAVYLSSDVANVESDKPTRMRLQVGIQASNRQGGHRSAMNIGLVFDMSKITPEYSSNMKELLLALLNSKQPGDKISLTVAGVPGGMLIAPKDFNHGPIQVVLNTLFSDEEVKNSSKLTLKQAITTASASLQTNDDPTASLGNSVLMLFSANSINDLSTIESIVHNNAMAGITTSTISMDANNQNELKKLALSGQGHARVIQLGVNASNEAKRIIDAELLASSRAVARALRLRIRLAKGVKLVEVLDSYNLNDQQSQRVRDAEQSLDKRLSKNLGIAADRGDDEEGIQIVIPSFFAGDTHVVLLDVVIDKPGPIADVSMRYKDLLYLRNAVARKQLNLDNQVKAIGPIQMNVIKNTLASHFTIKLKQASGSIKNGDQSNALLILESLHNLYKSLQNEFPVWNNDAEIINDLKLIQQYINLLKTSPISGVQQINYIVDSMQYISWRKHITQTK